MAAIQNIESLPKSSFFSELPCVYHQLLSAEELAGIKTWDLGDIVSVTESLSKRRNLQFTMIEFYQAYAVYNDMIDPSAFHHPYQEYTDW